MRCHKYSRSFGSIDRVDRWAVWRVLASLLPQTTLPQASPAAQLELDTRARRLCARGVVAGNAILGAFRCRSPQVTKLTPPDNPLQTVPFLIARYDDARAKPTHARALRRRRRSLDRARGVWRLRWRRRAVTSPVTRVTRAARHARVRVRHHRASRASSPFSVPPAHDRHARAAAAAALARSLDRAHAVWRWRWRWRSVTPRATHAARHTRARARHQSASHKERARLNRRTKQLEFDRDIARRDAAAARERGAAGREARGAEAGEAALKRAEEGAAAGAGLEANAAALCKRQAAAEAEAAQARGARAALEARVRALEAETAAQREREAEARRALVRPEGKTD